MFRISCFGRVSSVATQRQRSHQSPLPKSMMTVNRKQALKVILILSANAVCTPSSALFSASPASLEDNNNSLWIWPSQSYFQYPIMFRVFFHFCSSSLVVFWVFVSLKLVHILFKGLTTASYASNFFPRWRQSLDTEGEDIHSHHYLV